MQVAVEVVVMLMKVDIMEQVALAVEHRVLPIMQEVPTEQL